MHRAVRLRVARRRTGALESPAVEAALRVRKNLFNETEVDRYRAEDAELLVVPARLSFTHRTRTAPTQAAGRCLDVEGGSEAGTVSSGRVSRLARYRSIMTS